MEKTILLVDGKICKKDGSTFTQKEFYKVLKKNGYTMEGGIETLQKETVEKEKQLIIKHLTNEVMEKMIQKLLNFYEYESPLELDYFFNYEFGNGMFQTVFEENLPKEISTKYSELTSKWWELSDEINADLGDIVCAYIQKQYSEE